MIALIQNFRQFKLIYSDKKQIHFYFKNGEAQWSRRKELHMGTKIYWGTMYLDCGAYIFQNLSNFTF